MSDRRQKSRLGVLLLVIAVLVAAGVWFASSRLADYQYQKAAPLDVAAYTTSSNSLRGNTYRLEGEVQSLLTWSPSGRLVSVGLDGGKRAVPVLLPSDLNSTNIERGHQLRFLLVVDDQGILRATKISEP